MFGNLGTLASRVLMDGGSLLTLYQKADAILARLWEQIGPDDVLLVLSTSGKSPNLVEALKTARQCATLTVGLLGSNGGACGPLCDHEIRIPSVHESISPLVAVLPLQLLSLHLAKQRRRDVDRPR